MVALRRALSSSSVFSLSSNFGAATPVSRSTDSLEASLARWICPEKGSMSGASRASARLSGSIPASRACASALSISPRATFSPRRNMGTEARCIDKVIGSLLISA